LLRDGIFGEEVGKGQAKCSLTPPVRKNHRKVVYKLISPAPYLVIAKNKGKASLNKIKLESGKSKR